ncbi:MAG: ankyrin repeat domain-containing protein [Betaproteobacteria bacterium]|nr:ankyrin repeat domain-containing protein [Betaproteobacteria bacterium]
MIAKGTPPSKLITAIRAAHLGNVLVALAEGGNVDEPDMHGFAGLPLRTACFKGDLAIVRELLQHGANPNAEASDGPGAALRLALRCRHPEVASLLLQYGATLPDGLSIDSAIIPARTELLPERTVSTPPPKSTAADNLIEFTPSEIRYRIANSSESLDVFGTETHTLSADLLFLEDNEVPPIAWQTTKKPD